MALEQNMTFTLQAQTERLTFADRLGAKTADRTAVLTRRPRFSEGIIGTILFLCSAISIITTLGIVIVLGTEASRFFASTEWLSINRDTTAPITAEATTITIKAQGTAINPGDLLRLGQAKDSEIVRVTAVIDAETLEVERGVNDTVAVEHATTALYRGESVTIGKFLTTTKWAPQIGAFGIAPLVLSTFLISFIALLVSLPVGLGAAIYLSEYASQRVRQTIKPILEILAGVPTVVYGYIALTFMTPLLRAVFGNEVGVYNMASAGLVMGVMIIPTISSMSEDALNAVPQSLRDASYGLGATKLETIFKVLLPAALSGIVAAVILAISRAVGETMIVLLAAGAGPNLTLNPFDFGETMAGHIARISTGDISFGTIDYNSVFAVGMTLFVITLVLNLISTYITRRFREIY